MWERRCEKEVARKTLWEVNFRYDVVRKTLLEKCFEKMVLRKTLRETMKDAMRNTLWERRCEKDVVRKTLWERQTNITFYIWFVVVEVVFFFSIMNIVYLCFPSLTILHCNIVEVHGGSKVTDLPIRYWLMPCTHSANYILKTSWPRKLCPDIRDANLNRTSLRFKNDASHPIPWHDILTTRFDDETQCHTMPFIGRRNDVWLKVILMTLYYDKPFSSQYDVVRTLYSCWDMFRCY